MVGVCGIGPLVEGVVQGQHFTTALHHEKRMPQPTTTSQRLAYTTSRHKGSKRLRRGGWGADEGGGGAVLTCVRAVHALACRCRCASACRVCCRAWRWELCVRSARHCLHAFDTPASLAQLLAGSHTPHIS